MEPLTTATFLISILTGWLGNRTDFYLCKSYKSLLNKLKYKINEPGNHDIRKAIRSSYLKATLLAVRHIYSKKNRLEKFLGNDADSLKIMMNYLTEQISELETDQADIRITEFDFDYQSLLFPKNVSIQERLNDYIKDLINGMLGELEQKKIHFKDDLRDALSNGWTDNNTHVNCLNLRLVFLLKS
jgi:exonuclease I